MAKVFTHMTMSLDGFIADPADGVQEIFRWYETGPVEVPSADGRMTLRVDEDSAALLRDIMSDTGALVCGRRLFDITNGWDDSHPLGAPVVVVTHNAPPDAGKWKRTSFAPDVPAAMARAEQVADGKDVVIASADISGQALDLGLVDEVCISLAPVLLGKGIPYFAGLRQAPHRFDDPVVIQGSRATHLRFRLRRGRVVTSGA